MRALDSSVLPVLATVFVCAAAIQKPASVAEDAILRVRGIVVEDEEGRPRVLLGAPVPKVAGRKRTDEAVGLIVLGEDGADRVALGAPKPDPQILGKVGKRISPSAGIQVNDAEGNERCGFGYLDDGRVTFGLDYAAGREAVTLFVLPEGFAGLTVASEKGSGYERAGLVVNNETGGVRFKLADPDNRERLMFDVEGSGAARFRVYDEKEGVYRDALPAIPR